MPSLSQSLRDAAGRAKVRLMDDLRYSQGPREALGAMHAARMRLPVSRSRKLEHAVQAYRFAKSGLIRNPALGRLQRAMEDPIWREDRIGWDRYDEPMRQSELTRSVVLKAPGGDGEKGVLLMTFEYNWLRLLAGVGELSELEKDYDIIFSTSSSPSAYTLLGLALSSLEGTLFVQSCNFGEIQDMEALSPRVRCLPMLPCDWIDPSLYEPRPRNERDVDILMVAGWAPVKRGWQLYEALKDMPRDLRVVMIGQAEGHYDVEHAKEQARMFGAKQDIEFHQSMLIEDVARYQARAKTALIFSRREGCCVAVTESLFADTPMGLMADAHIGPLEYINEKTGVRLERKRKLSGQLMDFVERSEQFRPREWALENISNAASTAKLNAFLREHALKEGRPWTQDLVVPCWRPHPTVRHNPEGERLRPAYDDLHARWPKVFPSDLFDESWR